MSKLSHGAQLMFVKLIVAVDDYGRFDARPEILKGHLYPLEKGTDEAMIVEWIAELCGGENPPVELFTRDNRPYLFLTGWETHRGNSRRAVKSRFPDPSEGDLIASPEIREIREILGFPGDPPGSRESGVESREAGDTPSVAVAPCAAKIVKPEHRPLTEATVAKMIAVKPHGMVHTPAEVQSWFQAKAPLMSLKGRKNLTRTALNWWPHIKPGEVREAIKHLEDIRSRERANEIRAEIKARDEGRPEFSPEEIEEAANALHIIR